MRALRYHGDHVVQLDDIDEPVPQPGQVKVRIEWCGICGTDLHEYQHGPIFCPSASQPHPLTGETLPVVLGHEMAGRVVELGADVHTLRVGDAVAVEPTWGCGHCAPCRSGFYNQCQTVAVTGLSGGGGGLSEFVVVEAARAHPLGDIPTYIGAMVEPLAVAYHAVRLAGVQPKTTAVVFGAGPVGLLLIAVLRAVGAEVIAVEPGEARRQTALRAGAVLAVAPGDGVSEAVAQLTVGVGVDVAFECAGRDSALRSAIDVVRSFGTVGNIAVWERPAQVDMLPLLLKEVRMIGSFSFCGDFPATIALLASGDLKIDQLITSRIALEDAELNGLAELRDSPDRHVKILVHP